MVIEDLTDGVAMVAVLERFARSFESSVTVANHRLNWNPCPRFFAE